MDLYLASNCGTTLAGGGYGQKRYSSVRRAMETHRAVVTEAAAQPTRWSTMERQSSGAGRHLMDIEVRSPLARSACGVSEPFDVLAPAETLAGRRHVVAHLAIVPRPVGCPRSIAVGG